MASPRSTRVTTRVRSLSCATITRAAGSASHALIAFHAVRVLHAFAITLLDEASRNRELESKHAYKEFRKSWRNGVDAANTYLRQRCVDSMKKIKDSIVWEGMSFNTLAMAMSSHQDTTFGMPVHSTLWRVASRLIRWCGNPLLSLRCWATRA